MVAVVSSNSLGLLGSSLYGPGSQGSGQAAQGRAGERIYVNAATGNLVLQNGDELAVSRGPDLALLRTYNSQGLLDGDNNDNWRLGFYRKVYNLTGAVNTAGSTVTRVAEDGSESVYAYDTALAKYVGRDGTGAFDTLAYDAATQIWTWTDGDTQLREAYDGANGGRLTQVLDTDGNALSFTYNAAGLISQVTDASGESTFLDYAGTNLTQLRTVNSGGQTLIRTRYVYDTSNRLIQVRTDLTPENAADAATYVVSYTYDGTSTRIATMTQSDGTSLAFTYDAAFRVATITDALSQVTRFAYDTAARTTTVTDPLGLVTVLAYDAAGQLSRITGPAVGGTSQVVSYAYDAQGNVASVTDARGNVVTYGYDASGNRVLERDAAGNTVTRVFGASNELLAETSYAVPDPDGAGAGQPATPLTARYVYGAAGHLRFVVSAEGRVTEYRYNALGQAVASILYTQARYDVSGLAPSATLTEAQLFAWLPADRSPSQRIDTGYDFRGQVASVTTYARVDAAGNGVADGTQAVTLYVYDQAGKLLKTVDPRGSITVDPNDYTTSYVYDGMGRVLATTDALGRTNAIQYDDASRKTVLTLANGLTMTSTYDAAGRLVSVMQSANALALGETRYFYDTDGRLRRSEDPTGVKIHVLYDEAGRQVATIDGNGSLTEYRYDANNNLTRTIRYATAVSAANLASLVAADGRPADVALAAVRPAASSADRNSWSAYDAANRLVKSVDAAGFVTQSFYDGAGRATDVLRYATAIGTAALGDAPSAASINPAGGFADRVGRSLYDADGHLVGTLDGEGFLVERRYDAAGRLVETIGYATATNSALRATGTLAQLIPAASAGDIHSYTLYNARGQAAGTIDGEGYLTEYVYDAAGNTTQEIRYATSVTYAAGATLASLRPAASAQDQAAIYTYTALDQLASGRSPDGTLTQYLYDETGNLVKTVKAADTSEVRTLLAQYDKQGRLTAELSANGAALLTGNETQAQVDAIWAANATRYTYDAAGRKTSSTDPLGRRALYFYNADGQLTHTINALGEVEESVYDALGQVSQTVQYGTRLAAGTLAGLSGGLVTGAFTSALAALASTAVDSRTGYAYDATGNLAQTVDPLGNALAQTYNAFGEVAAQSQSLGAGQTLDHIYSYDRRGLLTQVVWDPSGINTSAGTVYDAFGRAIRTTDPRGNVSTRTYDRLGRVVTTTDPTNSVNSASYDAFGRVLTQTDALGKTTTYSYDTANRSVTVTTPEGVVARTTNNRHGETLSLTDGRGNTTSYLYDKNGNLLRIDAPAAGATTSSYDAANQVIQSADANGTATAYSYDAAGRVLTRTVDPGAGRLNLVTTYAYDAKGQMVTVTDAAGVVTQTSFDLNGQVTQVAVDPAGLNLRTTFAYDARGKALTVTEGAGSASPRLTQYAYDKPGRLVSQRVDLAGINATTTYAYDKNDNVAKTTDALGNVTRYAYDADDRLVFTVDALGGVVKNEYDAEGRVARRTAYATPIALAGLSDVPAVADIAARVVASAADETKSYVYDGDGREIFCIDALGGVTQKSYDGNGNLVRKVEYANAIPTGTALTRTAVTAALVASAADRVTRTVYDAANRAVFAIDPAGYVEETQYDNLGQITRTVQYTQPVALGATPSAAEAAAAVAADTNKQVNTFAYDAAGRLVAGTDAEGFSESYGYDAVGNRIRFTNKKGATWTYAYDAAGRLVSETSPQVAVTRLQSWSQDFSAGASGLSGSGLSNPAWMQATGGRLVAQTQPGATDSWPYLFGDRSYSFSAGVALRSEVTTGPTSTGRRLWVGASNDGLAQPNGYRRLAAVFNGGMVYADCYDAAHPNGGWIELGAVKDNTTYIVEVQTGASGAMVFVYEAGRDRASGYSYTSAFADSGSVHSTIWTQVGPGFANATMYVDNMSETTAVVTTEAVTTTMTYDALGNVLSRTEASGTPEARTTQYRYDALGRQIQTIDPGINVYNSAADQANNYLGRNESAVTPTSTTYYDALGRAVASKDASGAFSYKVYDQLGRVIYEVDAQRFVTAYAYDAFGNRTSLRRYASPLGEGLFTAREAQASATAIQALTTADTPAPGAGDRVITTTYDALNRATRVVEPTVYTFDSTAPAGSPQYFYVGKTTRKTYNAYGQVIKQSVLKNPGADLSAGTADDTWTDTYFYYDARGSRTAQIDSLGYLTTYQYDETGDLVRQVEYARVLNAGTWSTAGYAAPVATTPQSGPASPIGYDRETTWRYDRKNQKIAETRVNVEFTQDTGLPGGAPVLTRTVGDLATTYGYDGVGNMVSSVDPSGATTYIYYDALGRVTAAVEPARTVEGAGAPVMPLTEYKLDVFGNTVKEIGYARGAASATSSGYAAAGSDATNDQASYNFFDARGKVLRSIDALGNSRYFSYDAMGRTAKEWQPFTDGADGTEPGTVNGLLAEYYDNTTGQLKTTRIDPTVNFNWGAGSPDPLVSADNFFVRWSGQVQAQFSETYTFYTVSDDGVRLWVNGQLIIDNWTDHAPTGNAGWIDLVAGQRYDIRMEFYERGGGATATLSWASERQAMQIIPSSQLYVSGTGAARESNAVKVYQYDRAGHQTATLEALNPANPAEVVRSQARYNAFGEITAKGQNDQWQESFDYDNEGRLWRTNQDDGVARTYLYSLDGKATSEFRSQTNNLLAPSIDSPDDVVLMSGNMRTDSYFDALGRVIQQVQAAFSADAVSPPSAAVNKSLTFGVASSATLVGSEFGFSWSGTNQINVSWNAMGAWGQGQVKVRVDYTNYNTSGGAGVAASREVVLGAGAGDTGTSISWSDDAAAAYGGVSSVQRVQVWKQDSAGNWVLIHDQGASAGTYAKSLVWQAPTDLTTSISFKYRAPGSASWTSAPVYNMGSYVYASLAGVANNGTYEYEITYTRVGEAAPYARATGTITSLDSATTSLTFGIASSASNLYAGFGTYWYYPNTINVSWSPLADWGGGDVQVTIDYMTYNPNMGVGAAASQTQVLTSANGNTGATFSWWDATSAPNGGVQSVTRVRVWKKDASGVWQLVHDRGASATNYGRVFAWPAPAGTAVQFQYRPQGSANWSTLPAINMGAKRIVDPRGLAAGTTYEYQVIYTPAGGAAYTQASGTFTTAAGAPETVTVAPTSNLTLVQTPTMSQTLDRWGNALSSTDPRNGITRYRYDQQNKLVEQVQPQIDVWGTNGASTLQSPTVTNFYDRLGRAIGSRDANGNPITARYDEVGHLKAEYHPDGGVVTYGYDIFGREVRCTDAVGNVTRSTYDRGGHLLRKDRPIGSAAYAYDQLGNRIQESVAASATTNLVTRYWYDARGKVIRSRLPLENGETAARAKDTLYFYDSRGNKIREVNANGDAQSWVVDYFGRVASHIDLGGAAYTYAYDKAGHVTQQNLIRGATGATTSYQYYENGLLKKVTESEVDTAWADDAPPAGAWLQGDEPWTWVSGDLAPKSGTYAHQSAVRAGTHQHFFTGATATLQVNAGDTLYVWAYLDPANPPNEIMLQFNDGSWEHRAYWGANYIGWGADGTTSRRYMGALPAAGGWVRLEVAASQVGLEGRTLNGMSFTLNGGRVTWDKAGKISAGGADTVWFDDTPPAGAWLQGDEPWTWVSGDLAPQSGTLAHQSDVRAGIHQHTFSGATLQVNAGDTLYAWVYLDPANPPSEVMLQWNDGNWEHRAYWGANNIGWGWDGTTSRRYMGALPAAGGWVRLEVAASLVGLEGRTVNGMAFTLCGGRATWDKIGTIRPGAETFYEYDAAGNRTRERYIKGGVVQEDSRITYDRLGRIAAVQDAYYKATYGYDANGNRRYVGATYYDQNSNPRTLASWYTYDSMNRVTLSQGVLLGNTIQAVNASAAAPVNAQDVVVSYDANGNRVATASGSVQVTDAQGIQLAYDAAGNRRVATSYQNNALATDAYVYDGNNRLVSTSRGGALTTTRAYDWAGRLTEMVTYAGARSDAGPTPPAGGWAVSERRVNTYNNKSWLLRQEIYNAAGTLTQRTSYTSGGGQEGFAGGTPTNSQGDATGGGNGYDKVGNVVQYQVSVFTGTAYTNTYRYTYQKFDTYRESRIDGSSTYFQPGATTTVYDMNGAATSVTETFATNKNRSFINDAQGHVLVRNEGGNIQRYFYVGGMPVGTSGTLGPADFGSEGTHFVGGNDRSNGSAAALTAASFESSYTPISDTYPAAMPGRYVVSQGDTLRSIALAVFGDAQLWYLIADANGLRSDSDLIVGRTLTIPNSVTSVHNDFRTFKVYNPTEIIGDTTPTLPAPPPPSHHGGCGGFGAILVAIVSIVVAIVLPVIAPAIFSTSTLLGTVATAVVSNLAGQVTANIVGLQHGINFASIAVSALSAGITFGIVGGTGSPTPFGNAVGPVGRAIVGNVVNQGVGILLGQQKGFSWAAVAGAAVTASVTQALTGNPLGASGESAATQPASAATTAVATLVGGVAGGLVRAVLSGGKINFAQIAADAFGNALGTFIGMSIAENIGQQSAALTQARTDSARADAENAYAFASTDDQPMMRLGMGALALAGNETEAEDGPLVRVAERPSDRYPDAVYEEDIPPEAFRRAQADYEDPVLEWEIGPDGRLRPHSFVPGPSTPGGPTQLQGMIVYDDGEGRVLLRRDAPTDPDGGFGRGTAPTGSGPAGSGPAGSGPAGSGPAGPAGQPGVTPATPAENELVWRAALPPSGTSFGVVGASGSPTVNPVLATGVPVGVTQIYQYGSSAIGGAYQWLRDNSTALIGGSITSFRDAGLRLEYRARAMALSDLALHKINQAVANGSVQAAELWARAANIAREDLRREIQGRLSTGGRLVSQLVDKGMPWARAFDRYRVVPITILFNRAVPHPGPVDRFNTYLNIAEAAGRTRGVVNAFSYVSRAAGPIGIGLAGYHAISEVQAAAPQNRGRVIAEQVGQFAGGWGGFLAGTALTGLAVGALGLALPTLPLLLLAAGVGIGLALLVGSAGKYLGGQTYDLVAGRK